MKVLGICSFAGLGGCERSFALLLGHLPAGVEARAMVLGSGPLTQLLSSSGIGAEELPRYSRRPKARDLAAFTRVLAGQVRAERPDVIWASAHKAALLASPGARALGVPLVWHKVDYSWDRLLARPLAAAARGVTAVSAAVVEPAGAIGRRRLLAVIAPPVDPELDVEADPDPDQPVLGSIGRLVPYKGHHRVIEAAALLRPEFPRLRVVIAGQAVPEYPEYSAELRALASAAGLDECVELIGFAADIAPVLARLSVLVSATHRDARGYGLEGRGRAIIEASWCAIPVVAVGGGGVTESVIDGVTGTLVDRAEPNALAAAIRPYLRDLQLTRRTGARGREFARANFSAAPLGVQLAAALERGARA